MANCEEKPCANVQSAICLHCNRRLCAPHIIAHGSALLKEADELCEQINQLTEHLNVALKQINTTHSEAMNELGVWRQRQTDKIENKYAEKVRAIGSKQDYLVDLDNKLVQQLAKDAREPLERIQIQKSANNQVVQAIRQAIIDVQRKSAQLEWRPAEPSNQLSSIAMENIPTSTHQLYYSLQSHGQPQHGNNIPKAYFQEQTRMNPVTHQWVIDQPSVGNLPSRVQFGTPLNNVISNPRSSMDPSGFQSMGAPRFPLDQIGAFPPPYYTQLTVASATPVYQNLPQPTTTPPASTFVSVSRSTPFIEARKRPSGYSCENLITYFKNVSGLSDLILHNFIIHNLNRADNVNYMMMLLLSFLEAWHSIDSPTIYNERVLSYHIFTVKKYIIRPEHELTVLIAIQVFVNGCNYDDTKSSQMVSALLQHFLDHTCISKANILVWYGNGASFGYNGFQNAKLWAKTFIDQLSADVQPKQI